jgi:hypothetical protein
MSLNGEYSIKAANLKTPKLVRLRMDTPGNIDTGPMEHLEERMFRSYCCSFRTSVPDILRYTPNLVNFSVVPMCPGRRRTLSS